MCMAEQLFIILLSGFSCYVLAAIILLLPAQTKNHLTIYQLRNILYKVMDLCLT